MCGGERATTMIASDYDRVLASCLREIEAEIVRLVEHKFENLPASAVELPWIGGEPIIHYERAVQKELAVEGTTRKAVVQVRGAAVGAAPAVDRRGLLRDVQRAASRQPPVLACGTLWPARARDALGNHAHDAVRNFLCGRAGARSLADLKFGKNQNRSISSHHRKSGKLAGIQGQ